jgi:LmbE family N-acetylglucosaminyl deacetylase
MFFSPTILSLVKQNVHVKSLCLSSGMLLYLYLFSNVQLMHMRSFTVAASGNATGLGDIRSQELISSYRVLGLNDTDVRVVNHV